MLFQYIFRNFILFASLDNDKPMLMRQKENVNKEGFACRTVVDSDRRLFKISAVVIFRVKASRTRQNIN